MDYYDDPNKVFFFFKIFSLASLFKKCTQKRHSTTRKEKKRKTRVNQSDGTGKKKQPKKKKSNLDVEIKNKYSTI